MPDSDGLDTFIGIRDYAPQTPIILLTGLGDEDLAVAAVRAGAQDYIIKGQISSYFLSRSIRYSIERRQAEESLQKAYGEMERQVQERTEELRAVNERLKAEIDERTKAEDELFRLAAIVESSDDAIIGKDLDGMVVSWNGAAERFYGYSAAEAIGSHVSIVLPRGNEDEVTLVLERIRRGERISNFETTRRTKAGRIIDVSLTVSPIKNRTGTVTGVSTIARDISERKKRDAVLRESEARYKSLFDENHAIMLLIDFTTGEIVDANQAACAFYGYSQEGLRSMRIMDVNMLSSDEVLAEMDRARRSERYYFNFRHRLASGETRDVEVYSGPIVVNGRKLLYSVIHDVTNRRKAEEALRSSQQRLKLHIEKTPLAVIEWDTHFRVLSWNKSAERIFGYSEKEALGRHASFILPDSVRERINGIMTGLLEQKGGEQSTNENITKDGRIILCEWYNTPLTTSDGVVIGVTSLGLDVTERKEAERALRKLWVAVEQSPTSVVITDRDGNIEYANPKFAGLTGYTLEEVVGQNPRVLKSGKTTDEEYKTLWETILSGRAWRGEFYNKKKNGEYFWESAVIAPVKNEAGEIVGFIAVKEDITEHKAMEEAYAENRERYRLLAENSGDMIWTTDLDGVLTYVSPAVERLLGYSAEEYMAVDINASATPSSLRRGNEITRTIIDEARKGRKIRGLHAELEQFRKDGSIVWTDVSFGGLYDASGLLIGISGVSRDMTERKKAEEAVSRYHRFLENLSVTDGLTGIANRRHFDETLDREWRRARRNGKPIALIMMDVDFFKGYNDRYGHLAGDDCLRGVAQTMAELVRRPVDLLARYGGEEFVCILPETDLNGALWFARQISAKIDAIHIPSDCSEVSDHVTLSMGVTAMIPDQDGKSADLVGLADRLLYEAKQNGRNRIEGSDVKEASGSRMELAGFDEDIRAISVAGDGKDGP